MLFVSARAYQAQKSLIMLGLVQLSIRQTS